MKKGKCFRRKENTSIFTDRSIINTHCVLSTLKKHFCMKYLKREEYFYLHRLKYLYLKYDQTFISLSIQLLK